MLTPEILQAAIGCSAELAETWSPYLDSACVIYEINTTQRAAAFLAQIGFESERLAVTAENLNYSAEGLLATFGPHFTPATAAQCARNPQLIANVVYANRNGNGDLSSGDGWRYRGRGPIQITGKANYAVCGKALGLDLVGSPDLLLDPRNGAAAAAWFWQTHGCNEMADSDDFVDITRAINGGENGLDAREALWETAKTALAGVA